jgi:hypothetical protein
MPFNLESYRLNFHWPPDAPINVAGAYQTWDAQHYLFISQYGYARVASRVFYPLWPAVIYVTTLLSGGGGLAASLLAANLSAIGAMILLHRHAVVVTVACRSNKPTTSNPLPDPPHPLGLGWLKRLRIATASLRIFFLSASVFQRSFRLSRTKWVSCAKVPGRTSNPTAH